MKKLLFVFFPIVLLGAGCFGGASGTSGNDAGVFKTTDAGQQWSQMVLVPTAKGIGTLATTNILSLTMDPQDANYLYASTRNNGMLFTEDGALSWRQPKQKILNTGTVYDVAVDPKDVCTVYIVTERKLVGTTDCFRSLNEELYLENRGDATISQVNVDWFNTNTLWIGLSNGDVLKSENRGGDWRTIKKIGKEISQIIISNTDSRMILVSSFNGGIERTADGGETWEKVEFPKGTRSGEIVYNLTQNPDASVVIASTQHGLLRSNDFGKTWEQIQLLTAPGEAVIRSAAIDPKDSNVLYYATPGSFYRSVDGGLTWKTQKLPSAREARAMLVDPTNSSVLYIGEAVPVQK